MQITLNGKPYTIPNNYALEDLIIELNLGTKFAVEINKNIIPRSEYKVIQIKCSDNIEIIQAIGGG